MKKLIGILLLSLLVMSVCGFDVIFDPEGINETGGITVEELVGEIPADPGTPEEVVSSDPVSDIPAVEEPVIEEPVIEEPVIIEPELPVWQNIDEDQIALLSAVYDAMTETGKQYSGWFREGDYAPCTWQGVACEAGRVTGLTFKNAGFFTEFPEEILELTDLKELHMVDTLMRGPLPDDLFDDLGKLEVLELKGNFLTGSIPELPGAFAYYPMLRSVTISDDLEDDPRKAQLLARPEYADVAYYQVDPYEYPELDLTPGLDGELPSDWDRLPLLAEIDLSGNTLSGDIPDSYALLPLTKLDLSNNAEALNASEALYDHLASIGNPEIRLEGIRKPEPEPVPTEEPVIELPTEEPVIELPTEEPVIEWPTAEPMIEWPTEEPVVELPTAEPIIVPPTPEPVIEVPTEVPVIVIPTDEPVVVPPTLEPIPTDEWIPPEPVTPPTQPPFFNPPASPTEVPTQVPPTPVPPTQVPPSKEKPKKEQPTPIIIVVTATPVPQWYTATPQGYPSSPQRPPARPDNPPVYPNYPQQYYSYPTATPYTYYNPVWVYPTATSPYTYPQYVQNQQPTAVPTQDPASLLGFTYTMAEMTENNIPMIWRFTGMRDYCITYLDASGNLYPYYAMPWTNASELCNSSACSASVQNIPDELLQGGTFSLQLRARDAAGRTYLSDPVLMQVSLPEPTPMPEPEPQRSFLGGFFHWLFGPIIRLFGGK